LPVIYQNSEAITQWQFLKSRQQCFW